MHLLKDYFSPSFHPLCIAKTILDMDIEIFDGRIYKINIKKTNGIEIGDNITEQWNDFFSRNCFILM